MKTRSIRGAFGSAVLPATAAIIVAGSAIPAAAQVADATLLNIMRECAKIDDPTSRLACYDNNIRVGGATGQRPGVPGQGGTVQGGGAAADGASIGGFGAESVKSSDRFRSPEERGEGPNEIRARILDVREREPGIYLVTIEGDAQWLFTDAVARSFRPPRKGALVEVKRASLGSFLMVVDGQAAVRVRRLK